MMVDRRIIRNDIDDNIFNYFYTTTTTDATRSPSAKQTIIPRQICELPNPEHSKHLFDENANDKNVPLVASQGSYSHSWPQA